MKNIGYKPTFCNFLRFECELVLMHSGYTDLEYYFGNVHLHSHSWLQGFKIPLDSLVT